ncbi:MAG: beta-lactamase family protein [Anaerolineaceae bacterium]|nr:beta-lactamase family protein [Anaerolineaceae bacterium]
MPRHSIKNVIKELDHDLIAFMNENALSGLAAGVVHDGELVYAKGFGLAHGSEKRPVTADTGFRIASISKTFTAIAIMQLWEQNKLDLDEPVNNYLKAFQVIHPDPNAPLVTFRHMLTHTSGIGELRNNEDLLKALILNKDMGEVKIGEPIPTLKDFFNGVLTPDVYPEQKWAYANHAYAALGQLIEDISGEPFAEYMIRHVFEPLGMTKTDFLLSERVIESLSQGYISKKGGLKAVEFTEFPDLAAGSVISSVNEMGLYMQALLNGGSNGQGSVIKPETLEMMMTPHYQADPALAAMGLGFFLDDLNGNWIASHGGSLEGFNSIMRISPKDGTGLILMSNTSARKIYTLGETLLRKLVGAVSHTDRVPVKGIPSSPHVWKNLVGSYNPKRGLNSNARAWLMLGGEIEVYVKNNKLMMRSLLGTYKQGIELHPADASNELVFENVTDDKPTKLVFQRNAEGYIDRFSLTAMMFFTFYKRAVTETVRFKAMTIAGLLGGLILGILVRVCRKCCKKKNC